MQVGRMYRAEAAIAIKQNKKKRRVGHLYIEKMIVNCDRAKTATRKHSFKSAPLLDGQREERNWETANMQIEKGE